VTNNEKLGALVANRSSVKFGCGCVEPLRTGLLVIFEWKPQGFELFYFPAISVLAQIYNVGNSELSKGFNITPCRDRAAKGQVFAHPKNAHLLLPVAFISARPCAV
jgi:hypothetical protein